MSHQTVLTLTLESEAQVHIITDALFDYALSSSWEPYHDRWKLTLIVESETISELRSHIQLISVVHNISTHDIIETTPNNTDWLSENQDAIAPLSIGPFYIYGPHITHSNINSQIPIQLDSVSAFGSGNHPTTHECLLMLEHLKTISYMPAHVLDIGTGSGLLAIAAQKLWPDAKVIGTDIEIDSINTATLNAQANNTPAIQFIVSDGFSNPILTNTQRAQLICANLLSNLLIQLAPQIEHHLAPKGYVILSGILSEQEERITHHYTSLNLKLISRRPAGEWVTLLLQK